MNMINMNEIQKRIYLSYFEDGIWDIAFGFSILGFGLMMIFESNLPVIFIFLFLVTFPYIAKKKIVFPRKGSLNLLTKHRNLGLLTIFFSAFLVAAFLYGYIAQLYGGINWGFFLMGLMWVFILSALAYFLSFPRLYFYGLICFLLFISRDLFLTLPVKMTLGGFSFMLVGLVILILFLRKNPKQSLPTLEDLDKR